MGWVQAGLRDTNTDAQILCTRPLVFYKRLLQWREDYCNKDERLNSTLNIVNMPRDSYPRNRMKETVAGKLLRDRHGKSRGILTRLT